MLVFSTRFCLVPFQRGEGLSHFGIYLGCKPSRFVWDSLPADVVINFIYLHLSTNFTLDGPAFVTRHVPCRVVSRYVVLLVVFCFVMLCYVMLYCLVLSCVLFCCIVLCCVVLCCVVLCCLCFVVLRCNVLCYVASCRVVLYYVVL